MITNSTHEHGSLILINQHASFYGEQITELVKDFLSDPKYINFKTWSGSSRPHQHHYGDGGLLKHTCEVIQLCEKITEIYSLNDTRISSDVLFLSALFHDVGKLWDYKKNETGEWGGTDHKREIHHISRSAIEWNLIATKHEISQNMIDSVTHCILSHHGQREWGSPVSPKSREAWILHLCDGLSVRIDDCDKFDRIYKNENSEETKKAN